MIEREIEIERKDGGWANGPYIPIIIMNQFMNTYRLIFAQMMLVQDLAYHLIIRHHNNHFVAPHFPTLTDNPQHIKLVLLLILQRCNFKLQF